MDVRNKKFAKNGMWSLIQQAVAVICGLILPQFILSAYGSNVNGTITSITQFLSFITLLQGGIGTLARVAYYHPLAQRDDHGISVAYKTISGFFMRFSLVYAIYMLFLAVLYPLIFSTDYSFSYVFWLVIVIGLASVSEYFFGQASQFLLYADQKGYVYSLVQVLCLIISTAVCTWMISEGASVHLVKLVYSIVFTIRPIVLYLYVKKNYPIDSTVQEDKKLLSQKNAALIRHIAYYIHMSTDVMVLTVFTNALWVSVYSVHRYVVSCISNFLTSVLGNSEVVFGDMFAKKETNNLKKYIPVYDLLSKYLSVSVFSACAILISSFVNIYTRNVNDISYYYPIFALILVLGEMVYCMGITYQNVYIAAGHIKKTEWIAISEASINILVSIILVGKLGILGVAIGTLVAMTFKTIANMYYMQKHVIKLDLSYIVKSNTVCVVSCILCYVGFMKIFVYTPNTYLSFFVYAVIVFAIVALIIFLIFLSFFKEYFYEMIKRFRRR